MANTKVHALVRKSIRYLVLTVFLFMLLLQHVPFIAFADLTSTSLTLADSSQGATTTYTFTFTPDTGLAQDYDIRLTFPSGTDLSGVADADVTVDDAGSAIDAGDETAAIDDTNDHISINLDTVTGTTTTAITVTVADVVNPSYAGSFTVNIVTYDETDIALDSGTETFVIDEGVLMQKVDCDGTTGATLGTYATDCNLITSGTTVIAITDDILDFADDNSTADGDVLCTDDLAAPTEIHIDDDGDCSNGAGGSALVGSTPANATTQVTYVWGFVDEDADSLFDDGEDLMMFETVTPDDTTVSATGVQFDFDFGTQTGLELNDYIVVVFPDDISIIDASVADCDGTTTTNAGTCAGIANSTTVVSIDSDQLDMDGNDTVDGLALCTDSLTAPTEIHVDNAADCSDGAGSTYALLGSTPASATIEVTNAWAFIDSDADGFLDDGEDLFIMDTAGDTTINTVTTVSESFTESSTLTSISNGDNEVRILLGAAISANVAITFGLTGITNPTAGGAYLLGLEAFSEGLDNLVDMGSALANIGNTVSVSAVVTEALVMTLSNTSITLQVDPAVNSGQDKSESTTLTVSTNAESGYVLKARLDDGAGNAQLVKGADSITSDSQSSATDNYFGYTAADGSTPDLTDAVNGFAATATNLYSDAGTTALGGSSTADGATHTVNYDLNVSFTTPAGVYTGTVYYTVVATF